MECTQLAYLFTYGSGPKQIVTGLLKVVERNFNAQSLSLTWRKKGNEAYKTVKEGLAPSIATDRLQVALNHYSKALTYAENKQEKSSAAKNIAMVHWRLAKAGMTMGTLQAIIGNNFRLSLEHFSIAWHEGSSQTVEWLDSLVAASLGCWADLRQRVDEWEYERRIRELEKTVPLLLDQTTQAREYLEIATHYFHWSLQALGRREFRACLQRLGDCHFPVAEAKRLGKLEDAIIAEALLLEQDISIQTCVAESIKARERGEELLGHVLLDEEDLNIDAVWTVVDAFKESAMLTREHDIELEAMAYSALGRVYHKVLKLKYYAKRYLTRALQLASSMMPRNFSGVEWFEFAQETVKSYQLENVREEEAERHRQRETVMGEIKEDLDKLSKKYHESGRMEFLEYVYKNYPPKNKLHKLGEVPSAPDMNQVKKLYQKAVTHYHPDKVTEEEHGKQWKVLTEEITKFLTRTYESFKGC
ncbi:hypothetical protein BaRGS_00032284 [Batillaria attramentaria]|uniref:J domain-containing protein n=1 Tax=Batillaria attramentaria TaxID=370345 RepID=A0ABD0JN44_9CAEN